MKKVSSSDLSHYAHSFVHSNSKLTQSAIEHSVWKCAAFIYKVSFHYTPEQLIFVDESLCSGLCMSNSWSMSCVKSLFCPGQEMRSEFVIFLQANWYHYRYSVLHPLSWWNTAPQHCPGVFQLWVICRIHWGLLMQMNPFPRSNSIIVMDNCCIHKSPLVLDMIHNVYVYCYHFIIILISKLMVMLQWMALWMPLDMGFDSWKSWLNWVEIRRIWQEEWRSLPCSNQTSRFPCSCLSTTQQCCMAQDVEGWYKHSGYL